jgi:hypothetical protein
MSQKHEALEWYRHLKENAKCAQCGEGHPSFMEFHHLRPDDKFDTISNMVHYGYDLVTLKAELAKTIPLCANHHRLFHWDEKTKKNKQYGTMMIDFNE